MLGMEVVALSLIFLLGGLFWTLAEYFLHRFVMHAMRGRGIASREHLQHHAVRGYYATALQKGASAVVFLAILFPVLHLAAGAAAAVSFCAGFVTVYLLYEFLHRRAHTHPPRGTYGRWLRRNHTLHHFAVPRANMGVSVPWWDRVFGTSVDPGGPVRVPRRYAFDWMLTPEGELRDELAGEYELVGRPASETGREQAARDTRDAFASVAPAP